MNLPTAPISKIHQRFFLNCSGKCFLLPVMPSRDIVKVSELEGALLMKKYAISREFFPWNLFAPPISEKFLAMSVPHMKPPKGFWRDKELNVTTHEIERHSGEKLTCFVLHSLRTATPLFAGLTTTPRNWASISTTLASVVTVQVPHWRWVCA